jgi:hypothetical protein
MQSAGVEALWLKSLPGASVITNPAACVVFFATMSIYTNIYYNTYLLIRHMIAIPNSF